MRDIVEFNSSSFRPFLPESCQVNEEVYGAELGWWLSRALAEAGVPTSYPEAEDWGWLLGYEAASGSLFMILCRNTDESGNEWNLSINPVGRKMFGRDKPPYSEADDVISAIRTVVEGHSEISEIRWLYEDSSEE